MVIQDGVRLGDMSDLWDDSMSVGVQAMDDDHRIFLGLISELRQAKHDPHAEDSIGTYIDMLSQYADYHLTREENMMAAVNYPDIDDHRGSHEELRRRCRDFLRRYRHEADSVDPGELEEFLVEWWMRHISVEDQAYKPYVAGDATAEEAANAVRFPGDPTS